MSRFMFQKPQFVNGAEVPCREVAQSNQGLLPMSSSGTANYLSLDEFPHRTGSSPGRDVLPTRRWLVRTGPCTPSLGLGTLAGSRHRARVLSETGARTASALMRLVAKCEAEAKKGEVFELMNQLEDVIGQWRSSRA